MAYEEYQKKEVGFGLNAFNRPVEYSGPKAWIKMLMELIYLIPGTIPTDPEMGVGIQTYRYSFLDEIQTELESKINLQKKTYLPNVPIGDVTISTTEVDNITVMVLSFQITVDENVKTAYVAIDSSKKTMNYEISF